MSTPTPGTGTPGTGTPGTGTPRRPADEVEPADNGLNLVVLRGRVSTPPVLRVLPSGSRLVTLALRVPTGDATQTSVPVAVWEPAEWVVTCEPDDEVVVTGTVRRRFFRTGGVTGSRVEVQAVAIGRGGDRRRRAAVARRARTELANLD